MMICEATPQGVGTYFGKSSWKRWYRDFFKYVSDNDIKAISYINSNWDKLPMWKDWGWKDARVQANEEVKALWIEEISKEKYINSSKNLYNMLKFIPEVK